jgi:hypothetical protein
MVAKRLQSQNTGNRSDTWLQLQRCSNAPMSEHGTNRKKHKNLMSAQNFVWRSSIIICLHTDERVSNSHATPYTVQNKQLHSK